MANWHCNQAVLGIGGCFSWSNHNRTSSNALRSVGTCLIDFLKSFNCSKPFESTTPKPGCKRTCTPCRRIKSSLDLTLALPLINLPWNPYHFLIKLHQLYLIGVHVVSQCICFSPRVTCSTSMP